jgi:hypothetical protein
LEEHAYQSPGKSVISQIFKTLHQYFPSLKTHLASLPDSRRRKQYSTQELAMAGVCMFMLKEGSILSPVINATSKQDKTRPLPLHSFVDKQSAKAAFGVISVDSRVV